MTDIGAIIRLRTITEGAEKAAALGKNLDVLQGAVLKLAAGYATVAGAQKAWDIAKQGAAINQTRESFDRLNESVFKTPNLLNQMRESVRGTISDTELMQGLLKLTAGTTEDMAQRFASAAPQLLEIAKASNKLNPALGDTAFLYDSIATGIKRASPLILDNLGIVVKVGEANEKYAESVGKTVEELSAEEKQIALLNATLEAGGRLIDQVGGNVDSAADSYAQLEVAVKGAFSTFKSNTATAAADQMAGLAGGTDKAAAAFDRLAGAAGTALGFLIGSAAEAAGQLERVALLVDMERLAGELTELDPAAADRIYKESFGVYFDALERAITTDTSLADSMAEAHQEIFNRYEAALNNLPPSLDDVARSAAQADQVMLSYGRSTDTAAAANEELAMTAEEAAEAEAKLRDNMNKTTLLGISQRELWREAGASIQENMQQIRQTQAEEQAKMLEEAEEAAREAAIATAKAFGDIIAGIQDRDTPDLVSPERVISFVVSGPTAEQNALMEEYQELHDRAAERVRNLTFGIGTFGQEQEKVNEDLAEANAEMAHYAGLMAGMNLPTTEFGRRTEEMALNLDVARDAFFGMLQEEGAATDALARYGIFIGNFTEEQARAALITQELTTKMQNLAQQVAAGLITPEAADRQFQAFFANIQDDFNNLSFEVPVEPVAQEGFDNLNDFWDAQVTVTPVAEPVGEGFWEEQLGVGTVPIVFKPERDPADDAFFEEILGGGTKRVTTGVDVETTVDDAYAEIDAWYDSGQDRVAGFAVKTSDQDNSFATYRDDVTAFLEDEHIYTIEANADPAADEIQRQLSQFENYTVTVHANVVGIPESVNIPVSSAPPAQRRQHGGPVGWGQTYMVGEAGPELFVPWTAGQIVPGVSSPNSGYRQAAAQQHMNAPPVNINITVNGATDGRALRNAMDEGVYRLVQTIQRVGGAN